MYRCLLIYCVINAFTPGLGNILALNTVTNFVYGVSSLLPNVMEVRGSLYPVACDSYCFQ